MMRPTHRAFATTCVAVYATYTNNPMGYVAMPIAWLTASLPDLDSIGKRYEIPILKNIKHRGFVNGISHSVFPLIGLWYLYTLTSNAVTLGLFMGVFSHVLADAFSKGSVALFYPFQEYVIYPDGGYYVKGFRLPPLYRTDESVLGIPLSKKNPITKNIRIFWYIVTAILILSS